MTSTKQTKSDESKDDFIKFGDLIYLLSSEQEKGCYFFADDIGYVIRDNQSLIMNSDRLKTI